MSEANLEPKMRKEVVSLVAKLLFYDHGYKRVKGVSDMQNTWKTQLNEAFLLGSTQDHPLRANFKGRKSLVAKIEIEHPGLMLKLFRKAQKTIGNQATYAELASAMKNLAKTDQMGGHDLPLSRGIVYRWFRDVGGKEKSPKPKPYLTDDQKRGRKRWCETEKERMDEDGGNYYACFLDEKWFYTQSLRRKIKYLPAMVGEEGVEYEVPRTISRRNVAKVMFLGVVANPIPDRNFDGKIFLKRISEVRTYQRVSCNQNFTDCATTNAWLKNGGWSQFVTDGMTLSDLREVLEDQCGLEEDIADRIVLRFYIPGRDENTKQCKYIEDDDASVPDVSLGGYTLMVKFEKGDKREVDVSCDSNFMEETMPQVGKAIRDAYSWVDSDIPIYLYLDNAGGHGTDAAIERYVNLLENDYNVICVHQHPRSPETNMLDLGVWMALQNVVERLHYKKRHSPDALARSVNNALRELQDVKLSNVFRRWKFVLDLIIEDEGDNLKVESKRGKLFRAPSGEVENIGEAETGEAAETIDTADREDTDGVDALGNEDEEADRLDRDPGYIEPLDCWEEMAGDGLISKCCAKIHCKMSDIPVANTHRCLNCRGIMHGICGMEWNELSSNNLNICKTTLSEEGQIYLNEQHAMCDICLKCCEDLTQ
jgi:hypothetical protein